MLEIAEMGHEIESDGFELALDSSHAINLKTLVDRSLAPT